MDALFVDRLRSVFCRARRGSPSPACRSGWHSRLRPLPILFAPPLILAILLIRRTPVSMRLVAWIAGGILLINTPHYVRNWRMSGSPLGYDSAQGDGLFRWRNEHPGVKSTLSNFIRHSSDQLGGRDPISLRIRGSSRLRLRFQRVALESIPTIPEPPGLMPDSPRPSTPITRQTPTIVGTCLCSILAMLASPRSPASARRFFMAQRSLPGFLLFCFFLKWQPFTSRLELPLFVLGAPVAGYRRRSEESAAGTMVSPPCLPVPANNCASPLFQNWTRPLTGPHSLFVTARDDNYFRDMIQWDYRATYLHAVESLRLRSGCHNVGVDINRDQSRVSLPGNVLRERDPGRPFLAHRRAATRRRAMPPKAEQPARLRRLLPRLRLASQRGGTLPLTWARPSSSPTSSFFYRPRVRSCRRRSMGMACAAPNFDCMVVACSSEL